MTPSREPRGRTASVDDLKAISSLGGGAGWGSISRDSWERRGVRNPAYDPDRSRPSIGWVLEAGGEIVGCLGNLARRYRLGDRTLLAATAAGFVVQPEWRGGRPHLGACGGRQRGAGPVLGTTPAPPVSERFPCRHC